MHAQRRGWHTTFAAIARLAERTIARRALKAGVEVIRDVPYGPHPVAHKLDVYKPAGASGPLPIMLYIHGGGFVVCSKETHRGIALLKAAGPGYLVFNINYRLAPSHPYPAAIEDACMAYRWVVAHAKFYGGDPGRIVVAGESAGGNLALGVAIAATYRRPEEYARAVWDTRVVPRAVMPICPFLQASDPAHREGAGYWSAGAARDIAELYLGADSAATERTLMADPIRVLEECGPPRRPFPRVLSGVGTSDICWNDVKRLRKACKQHGIPAVVRYYRGEVHAFHVLRWRLAARRFWRLITDFMAEAALVPVAVAASAVTTRTRGARRFSRRRPRTRGRGRAAAVR